MAVAVLKTPRPAMPDLIAAARGLLLSTLVSALVSACATPPNSTTGSVQDPYETFNRKMFAFNNGLDRHAIEPASQIYEELTPSFARDRIADFFANIRGPVIFANDLLQGETSRAGTTFVRFGLNSTVGILGFWDVASEAGIDGHREDFGQTLGVWGTPDGPFLILPLLGPTTPRDLVGTFIDRSMDPLSYIQFDDDWQTGLAVRGGLGLVNGLNMRVRLDEQIDALNSQPEPYTALRRIYSSSRQAEILNGRVDESTAYDDLPDFDLLEEDDQAQMPSGEDKGEIK